MSGEGRRGGVSAIPDRTSLSATRARLQVQIVDEDDENLEGDLDAEIAERRLLHSLEKRDAGARHNYFYARNSVLTHGPLVLSKPGAEAFTKSMATYNREDLEGLWVVYCWMRDEWAG